MSYPPQGPRVPSLALNQNTADIGAGVTTVAVSALLYSTFTTAGVELTLRSLSVTLASVGKLLISGCVAFVCTSGTETLILRIYVDGSLKASSSKTKAANEVDAISLHHEGDYGAGAHTVELRAYSATYAVYVTQGGLYVYAVNA